jgi:hypothetical protein
MKEGRLIVVVDDLDFGINGVAFATKYSISMTLLMEV